MHHCGERRQEAITYCQIIRCYYAVLAMLPLVMQ